MVPDLKREKAIPTFPLNIKCMNLAALPMKIFVLFRLQFILDTISTVKVKKKRS